MNVLQDNIILTQVQASVLHVKLVNRKQKPIKQNALHVLKAALAVVVRQQHVQRAMLDFSEALQCSLSALHAIAVNINQ